MVAINAGTIGHINYRTDELISALDELTDEMGRTLGSVRLTAIEHCSVIVPKAMDEPWRKQNKRKGVTQSKRRKMNRRK